MPTIDPTASAAVVTGHSRGLGEAIAERLLSEGVRVLGISRHRHAPLAERYQSLQQAEVDLADDAGLSRWIKSGALAEFVRGCETPLLVNNAGVLQPIGPTQTHDLGFVARAVAVNVAAVFVLTAAFVQAAGGARERRVLQVSSGAGRKAYAGWSIYCATKAAVDQHARCVALDRTPNLLISSVAPGPVDTDMQAEIRASSNDCFPDRPRFVELHAEKALPTAEQTGGKLVEYLLSDVFGQEPVFDLRDFLVDEVGR
jgi:NAD(P)-dependent dehydrogenase (short-subunit alcohol dehydrogenase family)